MVDNFVRAETDMTLDRYVKQGAFGKYVIAAGRHFSNGLRLFAAPGYLLASGSAKDKWLFRAGISYEIHISERWTIAPEVFNDFLEGGGDTRVAGVAIGCGF